MGFAPGHTAAAVPSSEIKLARTEQLRQSLCGNSYQCEVVAFLTGHLMVHWEILPARVTFEEIRRRVSPGESRIRGIERRRTYKGLDEKMLKFHGVLSADEALVLEHQRGLDPRGSDVRLDTGTLMAPKIYPRKAIAAALWKRQPIFKSLWNFADHIKVLEAIVILQALKWRA